MPYATSTPSANDANTAPTNINELMTKRLLQLQQQQGEMPAGGIKVDSQAKAILDDSVEKSITNLWVASV
jgi:hypothetical protein